MTSTKNFKSHMTLKKTQSYHPQLKKYVEVTKHSSWQYIGKKHIIIPNGTGTQPVQLINYVTPK